GRAPSSPAGSWTITRQLYTLIALIGFAFLVLIVHQYNTMETVKINGLQFQRIADVEDVAASIVPSTLSLADAYLLFHRMLETRDPARLESWVGEFDRMRGAYEQGHQVHDSRLDGPEDRAIRAALVDRSYPPGRRFYQIAETEFLPAVRAGDRARAQQVLLGPLQRAYDENSQAIAEAIRLVNQRHQDELSEAARLLRGRRGLQR